MVVRILSRLHFSQIEAKYLKTKAISNLKSDMRVSFRWESVSGIIFLTAQKNCWHRQWDEVSTVAL